LRNIVGQQDAAIIPRYAGLTTFARLPRLEDVGGFDMAVLGVPFDNGTSYRPGARFGPAHVRQSSRLLRPYNANLEVLPFDAQQVVDAGDVPANPFDLGQSLASIEARAYELVEDDAKLLTIGGDHTISLPLLRAMHRRHGPVALLHFDAHLDTWDALYSARYVHGTPFRRAQEEGLFIEGRSSHVGIRSSVYSPDDFRDDAALGFSVVHCDEFETKGTAEVGAALMERFGDSPLYISIDIDVLDPSHAPGTGTPEAGGMTSRELLSLLRQFRGLNLVGADIVEVAPAYDHAELTGIAAANLGYELVSLIASNMK